MLTQKKILGLKPKKEAFYVWDKIGIKGAGRLGVKVQPSGNKLFYFRYFQEEKPAFMRLGIFPALTLVAARELSQKYSNQLSQGIDPKVKIAKDAQAIMIAAENEARKGSIKQLFESYTKQMERDNKRTYKQVFNALEKEVYPFIAPETKAKDVTTQDIIYILSAMIRRGADTQTNRVRSYLMAAFNYGLKHDNDPANYLEEAKFGLSFNPVSTIPKQKSFERVGHHYLLQDEIQTLFDDLDNEYQEIQMSSDMRNLIKLCFYTGGQRPIELMKSKWSSVNWKQKSLIIEHDISKNKREHIVPLTDSAIEILEKQYQQHKDSLYLFPQRLDEMQPMTSSSLTRAVSRYCAAVSNVRKFVPRDIRRTCKTLMGELGINAEIRNRIQNHAFNDVASKHYDRYSYLSEKRRALEAWEQTLTSMSIDNVIPISVAQLKYE